jgi:hypothetical protein
VHISCVKDDYWKEVDMTDALKLRAPLACRLARVDKQRFNEAVARGEYPCAPRAVQGVSRTLSIAETIALYCWGRMLELTISSKQAGNFACEILTLVKHIDEGRAPAHAWACIIKTGWDSYEFACSDPNEPDIEKRQKAGVVSPTPLNYGQSGVIFTINFQIAFIRGMIRQGVDEYRATLGEEEAIG